MTKYEEETICGGGHCGNVANANTNSQLETGNIGIGNTCTMATLNKMFARAVAESFFVRIDRIW